MLNMIDTQDKLKNFSEQQLVTEMQQPTGSAPQFMVLGEIERRKRMRQDMQRQEGLMQPTVAQEAVSAAGVPQQGIAGLAQSLAPKTDMAQNTGVGTVQQPVKMAVGGRMSGGTIANIANLKVVRPDLYEEYKDDPEMLELTAEFFASGAAVDAEQTGLEAIESPMNPKGIISTMSALATATDDEKTALLFPDGNRGVPVVQPPEMGPEFNEFGPEGLAARTAAAERDNQERMGFLAARDAEADRMMGINSPIGSSAVDSFGPDAFAQRTAAAEIQNQARLAEAAGIDARADRMMDINKIPERGLPELTSQRRAVDTPAYQGLQDLLQERREYADSGSTDNVESDAQRDDTLRFLRGAEGAPTDNRSLIDAIGSGKEDSGRARSGTIGVREGLYFPHTYAPEVTSLNKRSLDFLKSDTSVPREQIYDLSPQGRLKYENEEEFTTGTGGPMLSSEANAAINAVQAENSRRQDADSRRAATQNLRSTAASIASLENPQIAPASGLASVVADTPPTAPAMGVQADIDRLSGIINDSKLPPAVRANAAQELQALQNSIAVRQYGGNLSAAANGIDLPEGYIMGPMGPMLDPNYRSPGKTGNSLVNKAALAGTEALATLAESGAVDPTLTETAKTIAEQADFERVLNPINQEIAEITAALDNPYVPADLKIGMEARIAALKTEIPVAASAGPSKLVPPTMDSIKSTNSTASGYKRLIDPATGRTGLASYVAPEGSASSGTDAAFLSPKTTPVVKGGGTSGGTSVGTSGGTSAGSGQGRIADLIADRKKQGDQDKWLALAQAGLSLMSSGDFGKAGQEGLAALMAQRAQMNKFDTDMLKLESDLQLNNARIAASRRSGVAKPKAVPAAFLTDLRKQIEATEAKLSNLRAPVPAGRIYGAAQDPDAALRTRLENELQSIQGQIDFMYSSRGLPTVSGNAKRTKV